MNDNKNYVIVSHCHEMATYYEGYERGYVYTDDVRKAMRFSWKELAEMFADPTDFMMLGVTIVRIEDCTFEKLEHDEALREKYYRNFLDVAR